MVDDAIESRLKKTLNALEDKLAKAIDGFKDSATQLQKKALDQTSRQPKVLQLAAHGPMKALRKTHPS